MLSGDWIGPSMAIASGQGLGVRDSGVNDKLNLIFVGMATLSLSWSVCSHPV